MKKAPLPSMPVNRRHIGIAVFFTAAVALAWTNFPVFSQSKYTMGALYHCTREPAIIEAFQLMEASSGKTSLDRILQKPMRVIFKNMGEFGKGFRKYHALTLADSYGRPMIYINLDHKTSPTEALAALISHEAMHFDAYNSLQEEVAGWREEAQVWAQMKRLNPTLDKIPPGQDALVDRLNAIAEEERKGTLEAFVRSRTGYMKLPETSPGFGDKPAVTGESAALGKN